jgi:hypothetical protein
MNQSVAFDQANNVTQQISIQMLEIWLISNWSNLLFPELDKIIKEITGILKETFLM